MLVAVTAGAVAVFGVVRSNGDHSAQAAPPGHALPYTTVSYTAADARRAFKAAGIVLTFRSQSTGVTTLGNPGDVLEVDAFGEREEVERAGFYNYTQVNGRYVPFPASCADGASAAARWRGNVRVVVSCAAAGDDAARWLLRVDDALARL